MNATIRAGLLSFAITVLLTLTVFHVPVWLKWWDYPQWVRHLQPAILVSMTLFLYAFFKKYV